MLDLLIIKLNKPLPKPLTPFRHYFPSLLLGVDVVRVAPVASSVWGLRTPPSRGQQSDADGEGEQRCAIVTQTPAPTSQYCHPVVVSNNILPMSNQFSALDALKQ